MATQFPKFEAGFLAETGCAVFLLDFQAPGESGGAFVAFGPLTDFMAKVLLFQFEQGFGTAADQLRQIDQIATLGVPVFVIAGGEDRHTTPENSLRLFVQAVEPKRFWLVEGAGHVDLHRQSPLTCEGKVLAFLADHLPRL